jgi:hypothetical protein
MSEIRITINGMNELKDYFIRLPKNISLEINQVQKEWCSFVQKSIKLRMPHITGDAAALVEVTGKKNKYTISMNAPYTYFILNNWKPHWIHAEMDTRMGRNVGDVLNFAGFMFVKPHNKQILEPALENGINRLTNMLNKAMDKSLQ